eukprot:109009_1
MGKGRFTALDVTAMTTSLKEILIGTRVANIYDLNGRTYLLKFSGKDKRLFLIMESGIRFHCTRFMRELPPMPNHFASKLRKYLRSKKISFIRQIGRDRIVIFEFGASEHKLYLILELYGGGNILLCDYEWNIIICLRVHGDIKHGEKYPSIARSYQKTDDKAAIEQKLRKCIAIALKNQHKDKHNPKQKPLSNRQKRKQRMNQKMETIHDFITKTMSASPLIIQSIIHKCKINKNESLLQYALAPYPILKPDTKRTNKKTSDMTKPNESDASSDSESEDEEDTETEDPMYADMTQEEKIDAMQINGDKLSHLMACFMEYEQLIHSLNNDVVQGFIISKRISLIPSKKINIFVKKPRRKQVKPTIDLEENEDNHEVEKDTKQTEQMEQKEDNIKFIYDEFVPFAISDEVSRKDTKIDSWKTFNACVDEFYSSNEAVKSDVKQTRAEMLAFKKLETAKGQHEQRVHKLQSEANDMAFYASVIEENLEIVDKAISGVNTLLNQGIDWNDLGNRIREETQFANPIASMITSLKLHQGVITLKLKHETIIYPDSDSNQETENNDSDSDASDLSDMFDEDAAAKDKESPRNQIETEEVYKVQTEYFRIDVELRLSGWNNARKYYAMKKQLMDKKEKTLEATKKALAAAEKKSKLALAEAKQTSQIEKLRKTYWFEKFFWFISSDSLLVIAGRDAQQNEVIVKKYMDKQRDIYVHALIHGASSVVIKNPNALKTIPPRTLTEAGAMCVCRSRAWMNNVSTESYWVYGHQVSKTPQSGQYLPTGSFVIRGKRNFITQQQLQMAIVLLFRIDQKSYERNHANERKINYFNTNDTEQEDKEMKLKKNKQIGDVTQQFILDDIMNNEDEDERQEEKKKSKNKNEDNAIYVTRTMIHSDPRQRKKFEEQQRQNKTNTKQNTEEENGENAEETEKKKKGKKMNKTQKKLAKYGFDQKDKKLSKREKNKRRKRGKYNRKYDETDQKLIQELLGIKPEHLKKEKEVDQKEENAKKTKQNEPKEGYELNANPMNLNRNIEQKKDGNNDVEQEARAAPPEEDEYDKQRKFALTNRLGDDLKLLTGKIYESDTILYCMTMCAPYSCVGNRDEYDYKIKIQPGTTKRGKAVKYVSELFRNMCGASVLNEKLNLLSLCKAIKDTEINHIFLSNVKLSSPGMKSLKMQHKKNQKKMQKEKWNEKQKMMEKQQKQNKQHNPSTNPKKRKKRK